jgi:hypothetical protein
MNNIYNVVFLAFCLTKSGLINLEWKVIQYHFSATFIVIFLLCMNFECVKCVNINTAIYVVSI